MNNLLAILSATAVISGSSVAAIDLQDRSKYLKKGEGKDVCYALCLAGGGTRGAYEAGVIYGMLHADNDTSKYAYDVLTGVSAGSINTGALSLFEIGDETRAFDVISEEW